MLWVFGLHPHSRSIMFRGGGHKGRNGPNLSIAISSSSRSPCDSGDYAEIGPVLQMALRSNTGNTHEYSEIPELPSPRNRNEHPSRQTRDENPYDEPSLPADFHARQIASPRNAHGSTTPEMVSGDSATDSSVSHAYQILERVPKLVNHHAPPTSPPPAPPTASAPPTSLPPAPPTSPPPPTSDIDNPSIVSSPVSPHSYHILEESLSYPGFDGAVGEDYLYPTITESSTARLSTIPEHPYNVLGGSPQLPLLVRLSSEDTDTDVKEAMPDFVDLEISEAATPPSTSKDTTACYEDREYDRLVGPTRLYHILERSPASNRPRIRGLPGGYDRLDSGIGTLQLDQSSRGIRLESPQTEETTASSVSGLSCLSSKENSPSGQEPQVFDDPQYVVGPKRKAKKTVSDNSEVLNSKGRSRAHVLDDIDLAKYCGNYERDPCYMARLHRVLAAQRRTKEAEDCSDYASYSRSSRFSTLSGGSSLPDIAHVYQSLEADTKDPLQPYEKVRRILLKRETEI